MSPHLSKNIANIYIFCQNENQSGHTLKCSRSYSELFLYTLSLKISILRGKTLPYLKNVSSA